MWPVLIDNTGYETDDSEKVPSVISIDDEEEDSTSLKKLQRMKTSQAKKSPIHLDPEPYEPEHMFFSVTILK